MHTLKWLCLLEPIKMLYFFPQEELKTKFSRIMKKLNHGTMSLLNMRFNLVVGITLLSNLNLKMTLHSNGISYHAMSLNNYQRLNMDMILILGRKETEILETTMTNIMVTMMMMTMTSETHQMMLNQLRVQKK